MRLSPCIICLLFAGFVFAQDADEAAYTGSWRSTSDSGVKWVLNAHDDQIHIRELDGARTKADYSCNTLGKECEIKEEGHPAKVSLWFNGPNLVELETRGNVVLKRRFEITNKGTTLAVETVPVAPSGKTEKLEFQRE